MANLTLSVDEDLLRRARELALRENNTSVNPLVRDFLTHYVDARSRRLQALDALEKVADRTKSRSEGCASLPRTTRS
jgi:predicted transcriptional regulator